MLLDSKLKRVALLAAVDFCLNNMHHSPKRCARNLVELGTMAYPDQLTKPERDQLYQTLLNFFTHGDIPSAKALFTVTFYKSDI